jgi:signal transduction histidine kinase
MSLTTNTKHLATAHPAAPQAFQSWKVTVALMCSLMAILATTLLLYKLTQQLFRDGLDDRMIAAASIAAAQFDPVPLEAIRGPQSVKTEAYRHAVLQLRWIRANTANVKYIYILRKTKDPNQLEFVADADSLDPSAKIDLNGDGVIDDQDALTSPGDPYDIQPFPEFRAAAFSRPFVDPSISHDQWGSFLSGTAPIRSFGKMTEPTSYVLGLDMDVSHFEAVVNTALVPFLVFVAFLVAIITTLALMLKRMWRHQVTILADLDRQKDELLGIVAHQLATPITAVKWSTELLLSGDLGQMIKAQQDEVTTIQMVSAQLTDLVGMILDVSRIQLGRINLNSVPLDLHAMLKEILDVIRIKAQEKHVRLNVELPEKLPVALLDRRYTHMTLENLLSNAVKYTPAEGRVDFTVTLKDDVLHCVVADTGCGIPKDEQGKIFGKLYRASNVRNAVEGNGFGLYVAKGAIEAQGGSIRFTSVEGQGTTFYIDLPLRYPPSTSQSPEPVPGINPGPAPASLPVSSPRP